jgi:hypothetical protein
MPEGLNGGTSKLLQMARSECRCAIAFVALEHGEEVFVAADPAPTAGDALDPEAVDGLVRQVWSDPEFGRARAVVRTTRLARPGSGGPQRLVLAVVPLGDGATGRPSGMLGAVGPEGGSFGPPQLASLDRLGRRLASYLQARHEVGEIAAIGTAGPPVGPAPAVAGVLHRTGVGVEEAAGANGYHHFGSNGHGGAPPPPDAGPGRSDW